jgi:hypothetical protein
VAAQAVITQAAKIYPANPALSCFELNVAFTLQVKQNSGNRRDVLRLSLG